MTMTKPSTPNSSLLTANEAASYLRISTTILFDISAPNGPLPVVRFGTGKKMVLRYRISDIDNFISQNTVTQTQDMATNDTLRTINRHQADAAIAERWRYFALFAVCLLRFVDWVIRSAVSCW